MAHTTSVITHTAKNNCVIHLFIHSTYSIAYKILFKMSVDLGILPCGVCGVVKEDNTCMQTKKIQMPFIARVEGYEHNERLQQRA